MRNQVENRAGLTPAGETELMPRIVTGQTLPGETDITPPTGTRLARKPRRYKKRARKCRCGCGELVEPTAQAPGKVYASDACRKRDYRRRRAKAQARAGAAPTHEAMLELATCAYCGASFFYTQGHAAKYCRPSHRVAAAEARRAAAVDALIAELHYTEDQALDIVDRTGMKLIARFLRQRQYEYDEHTRRWSIPLRIVTSRGT